MPMTTFLHGRETGKQLPSKDLQDLLNEVRRLTGKDWQVVPRDVVVKKFGWLGPRRVIEQWWELYVYVGGIGPWQAINFYNDDSEYSINHTVRLGYIVAYLYGITAGLDAPK